MFRTAIIAGLIILAGGMTVMSTGPVALSARPGSPAGRADNRSTAGETGINAKSQPVQFDAINWEMPTDDTASSPEIFDIFTPFVKTLSSPAVTRPTLTNSPQSISLPQNILTIKPLHSLSQYMEATAGAGGAAASNACPPGVDSIGGRTLPETHNYGNASAYGSIRDEYFVEKYLNDESFGEPALLGSDPNGLLLPESDPRIQELAARYSATHGGTTKPVPNILRLNPESCYISARWSYRNPSNTGRGTDSGNLYTNENTRVILTNSNGGSFVCIPVDWGPGYNENSADFDIPYALFNQYGSSGWSVKFAPNQNAPQGPCDGTAAIRDEGVPPDDPNSGGGGGSGSSGGSSGSTAYCGNDYYWSSEPNCCYKHTGPAGGPNQYDMVQTCNAGWIMVGHTPKFIPDCGPLGKLCNRALSISMPAPMGGPLLSCLFTACAPGRNAIWDPMTKRCGCDDGLGGLAFSNNSSGGFDNVGGTDNNPGGTPPDSQATGDQLANKTKLEAAGVTLKVGGNVQVGGLRENSINGITTFAEGYDKAFPGEGLVITSGTEGDHDSTLTYSHENGYKNDFRVTPHLVQYIHLTMRLDHSSSAGAVYFDGAGNRFFIENGGTAPHVDVSWQGNNLK